MSFKLTRKYKIRTFDVGSIRRACVKVEGLLEGEHLRRINAAYRFKDDVAHEKQLSLEDLDLVTELALPLKELSLLFLEDMTIKVMVIFIYDSDSTDFHILVQATSAEQCRELQSIFKNELGLSEASDTEAAEYERPISGPISPRGMQAQRTEPKYPEKVTIKWLYHNVPLSTWIWLAGLLVAAFGAGIAFTETKLYEGLKVSAQEEEPK